jgi:hypothetical protein
LAAVAGGLVLAGGAAHATPLAAEGLTLQEIQAWMTAEGFTTTINVEHNYVLAEAGSDKVAVFAGDCRNLHCRSIQYFFGINFNGQGVAPDDASALKIANDWNLRYRWARAAIGPNRDIAITYDFALTPNVDSESLNHSLITFLGSIPVFRTYLSMTRTKTP